MKVSLAAMRVHRDIKQKDAAKALGVSVTTLRSWETNKTTPNVNQFEKIKKLYQCSSDDLFLPALLA